MDNTSLWQRLGLATEENELPGLPMYFTTSNVALIGLMLFLVFAAHTVFAAYWSKK